MQKTCKNELCKRNVDRTSQFDYCPQCTHMLKLGESQTQRRTTNQTRQNKARTEVFDNNREISGFDFSSPNNERVSHAVPVPSIPTIVTTATSSIPSVTNTLSATPMTAQAPILDINRLYSNLQTMSATTSTAPNTDVFKDMYGMLFHLVKKSDDTDLMKKDLASNSQRMPL